MFHFTKFFTAAVLAAVVAVPVVAQSSQQIRIQNNSGVTLQYPYFSRTDTQSWEQDRLGANVLRPGQYLDLTIRNVNNCFYDMLMQFENGQEMTDVVNVCSVGTYTIN